MAFIYLICNQDRVKTMIKSGEEPEEFRERAGKDKTIITLTRADVKDIITLNERG